MMCLRALLATARDLSCLVVAALLAGCAHAPPVVTGPPICLSEDPRPYDGCGGDLATREGYTCRLCDFERGCVALDFTYCATTCDDPRCAAGKASK